MEKDLVFHALKDSMENDCCPICRQVDGSVRQTMRSILYEGMTDMDIRTAIMTQRGFCSHHSRLFLEEGDSLAHAIVYSDALRGALQDVVADDYTKYETEKDCYFCSHARQTEENYVSACRKAFGDEEFMETYRNKGLLCLHHLYAIRQETLKHKDPEDYFIGIAQATVDKYQEMIKQLDEIQRKNDYRFAGEAWTEGEKTAWVRAVDVIHDKVGLPKKTAAKKGFSLFRERRSR